MFYEADEWPHGLRCAACNEQFVDGQPISERLDCFIGETPVVVLTCVPCNLTGAPLDDE